MKNIVRYRALTIPGKLIGELRLTIEDGRSSPEYSSVFEGGRSTNMSLFPVLSINIIRSPEIDEIGNKVRAPWNINDSITMTKFTLPIFLNEIKTLYEEIKKPDMYTYHGDRLELNEKLANEIRHVFMIGNTTLELIPVVIDNKGTLVEGIKMKFNNEKSSVLLTINEFISFIYLVDHVDMDSIALNLYFNFMRKIAIEDPKDETPRVEVDIKPVKKVHKDNSFDIKEGITDINVSESN